MDNRTAFLGGAILDAQSIIRAIDVKIGALLVGLLAPLSSLGKIWNVLMHVSVIAPVSIGIGLAALFFLTWICAIVALVRALSAIDNPSHHIVNSERYKGSFYAGGLYHFGALDVFFNRAIIKASKDVAAFIAEAPETKEQIDNELAFEQLKLIYIRDAKLFRLHAGIIFASMWVAIGIAIFFYSKFS